VTSTNGDSRRILVIGGGISGVSAAVEASEAGYDVVLVERNPYLGGRVAQMNKYFPKLCPPLCGLEHSFKVLRRPSKVRVLTQAEVKDVRGSAGAFEVDVEVKPRFVNDRCTACGKCVDACPVERPNSFNYGMDATKAIYLPYQGAIPFRFAIDMDHCDGESCGKCAEVCEYDAIDLKEQPRTETISQRGRDVKLVRIAPAEFDEAQWTVKQWNVFDGLKVNGAGAGYFEYRVPWPAGLKANSIDTASFRAELSAKQLFGKDKKGATKQEGDFMRGKGTHDPSLNPNAYPMTDEQTYPSAVRLRIGGQSLGLFELPDDPADHRGILSWHSQKRNNKLNEAGSYGYLVTGEIPQSVLRQGQRSGTLVIRLEVNKALAGGLAIYGEQFGRYALDPTLAFVLK